MCTPRIYQGKGYEWSIACGKCRKSRHIAGQFVRGALADVAVADLWQRQAFRCSDCGEPATVLKVLRASVGRYVEVLRLERS